jgi:hypothetical protein
MAVHCPCGTQCRGFYPGRSSDCELVEESTEIPQRFVDRMGAMVTESVDMNEGFLGKLLGGLAAGGVAAYTIHKGDSCEVFQCSDCMCEVCYVIMSEEGSRRRTMVGEIARCES